MLHIHMHGIINLTKIILFTGLGLIFSPGLGFPGLGSFFPRTWFLPGLGSFFPRTWFLPGLGLHCLPGLGSPGLGLTLFLLGFVFEVLDHVFQKHFLLLSSHLSNPSQHPVFDSWLISIGVAYLVFHACIATACLAQVTSHQIWIPSCWYSDTFMKISVQTCMKAMNDIRNKFPLRATAEFF